MNIPKDTIDRILTDQNIPATLQADGELRAIAHSIARLDALRDIYGGQLSTRTSELLHAGNPNPRDAG
jgi:hypothetical protein